MRPATRPPVVVGIYPRAVAQWRLCWVRVFAVYTAAKEGQQCSTDLYSTLELVVEQFCSGPAATTVLA